jgi:putative lipoprotein
MFRRLALLACLAVAPPTFADVLDRLAGSVRYAERIALPPDATLTVELLDVSRARAERLARLALPTRGRQPPLAFELPFHPGDLKPGRRYLLRATLISGGGELLFSGTQTIASAGAGMNLTLRTARDTAPPTPLENTYWKLTEVTGQPARALPGEREAHLLLLDGRASGNSGCNKLMGGYTRNGDALAIGPLASTRMACPPELMAQENALLDAYARATGFRIEGESLTLTRDDAVLARFGARYFK